MGGEFYHWFNTGHKILPLIDKERHFSSLGLGENISALFTLTNQYLFYFCRKLIQMRKPMHHAAPPRNFIHAKQLRSTMTEAEERLWSYLSGKKLDGFKFRRQHPLHAFIIDFYCHEARLSIELDGEYHFTPEQTAHDRERTKIIEGLGVRELRFTNAQVYLDIEGVLQKIREQLAP